MPRVNRDRYVGGHLFALVDRVTGLIDSEDEVMATVRALEEEGVATDDIDIFAGEQGARCLDLSGREHGRVITCCERLEAAMGDESEPNHRIDEALRRGETLLSVKVHTRPSEKVSGRGPQGAHGHEIHYWGPWSFEDVPVETSRALSGRSPRKNSG